MQEIFDRRIPDSQDVEKIRRIVLSSGSVEFCRSHIRRLVRAAIASCRGLSIKKPYKELLLSLPSLILKA